VLAGFCWEASTIPRLHHFRHHKPVSCPLAQDEGQVDFLRCSPTRPSVRALLSPCAVSCAPCSAEINKLERMVGGGIGGFTRVRRVTIDPTLPGEGPAYQAQVDAVAQLIASEIMPALVRRAWSMGEGGRGGRTTRMWSPVGCLSLLLDKHTDETRRGNGGVEVGRGQAGGEGEGKAEEVEGRDEP